METKLKHQVGDFVGYSTYRDEFAGELIATADRKRKSGGNKGKVISEGWIVLLCENANACQLKWVPVSQLYTLPRPRWIEQHRKDRVARLLSNMGQSVPFAGAAEGI